MAALDLACRAVLAVVFAVAVVGKLSSRRAFADLVEQLRPLLPGRSARTAAVGLTAAECAAAVLLVLAPVAGQLLAVVTLLSLTAGVWIVLRQGLQVRCACFGRKSAVLNRGHLLRNGLLVAVAAAGLTGHLTGTSGSSVGAAVGAIGLGGLLGLCLTRWDDLTYLIAGST